MIAALKQYGTNYAKSTVERQLVRYAVLGVLVVVGFVYKMVTGESLASDADTSASPPAASAPAPAPATTPITAPAQAAPITSAGIDINAPKRAAQNAVAATNAQLVAPTGQTVATAAPSPGPRDPPSR